MTFSHQIVILVALVACVESLKMQVNTNQWLEGLNKKQQKAVALMNMLDAVVGDVRANAGDNTLEQMNTKLIEAYATTAEENDIEGFKFMIGNSTFLESFKDVILHELNEETDGSSSGSDFIMNKDWVLKTEEENFVENLKTLSNSYAQHMVQNQDSTIAKYVLVVKINGKYWTVMRNINNNPTKNIQRFDMKVSRPAKKAHQKNFAGANGQLGFLGDWMMEYNNIQFDNASDRQVLLKALEKDLAFFSETWNLVQLVDYSILILIQDRPNSANPLDFDPSQGIPVTTQKYGPKLMKVGIIDILAPFDFGKRFQSSKEALFNDWALLENEPRFTERYAANLNRLAKGIFDPAVRKQNDPALNERMMRYQLIAEGKMEKSKVLVNGEKLSQQMLFQINGMKKTQGWEEMDKFDTNHSRRRVVDSNDDGMGIFDVIKNEKIADQNEAFLQKDMLAPVELPKSRIGIHNARQSRILRAEEADVSAEELVFRVPEEDHVFLLDMMQAQAAQLDFQRIEQKLNALRKFGNNKAALIHALNFLKVSNSEAFFGMQFLIEDMYQL